MKKLTQILSILTIYLAILIPSTVLASTATNQIILHVNSSILDTHTNLYIAEVMTENGDLYVIESYDDISNQWLDAKINQSGEILDYTIMEDN